MTVDKTRFVWYNNNVNNTFDIYPSHLLSIGQIEVLRTKAAPVIPGYCAEVVFVV